MSSESAPFVKDGITFLPSAHGRVEFALEVRRQFYAARPDAICVELPKTVEARVLEAVHRLPYLSVVLYQEKNGDFVYLPIEPTDAMVEAIRLGLQHSLPVFFTDHDVENYSLFSDRVPDPYAIRRIGFRTFCEQVATHSPPPSPEDTLREETMIYHLQRTRQVYARVLWVGGLYHFRRVMEGMDRPRGIPFGRTQREGVLLSNLHADSSREILSEMPFLANLYEDRRQISGPFDLDRLRVQYELLQAAGVEYKKFTSAEVTTQQWRTLTKFARHYAYVTGYLTPDFYQLVMAAKSTIDDNYGYEVWRLGSEYAAQDASQSLPTLRLRGEDLYLDNKKIRLQRKSFKPRFRLMPTTFKPREGPEQREKYKKLWSGESICSYPPEDIVVEGYGVFLQKKALSILSEEYNRVEPFQTSILDGIDLRETLRNFYRKQIFVKENRRVRGKIGSLVLIFDDDHGPAEKYPYKMTWLGEHEHESDMAFYATPAGEVVVGPGISRCEYGGFMMTYPPRRVYDIWIDRYFDFAHSKSERLLLAAIDYSVEKYIAYVASRPPRSFFQTWAARQAKKVLFIPLGQLSSVMLHKIRAFHVLDGYAVRTWAGRFI